MICSFDGRWIASTVSSEPQTSPLVQSNYTDLTIFEESSLQKGFKRDKAAYGRSLNFSDPIIFPYSWLNLFDSRNRNVSRISTYLNTLVRAECFQENVDDMPTNVESQAFNEYKTRVTNIIGTFQSTLLADGLARLAFPLWSPILDIRPNHSGQPEYISPMTSVGRASPISNFSEYYVNTPKDAPIVDMDAFRYGYGYGIQSNDISISVIFALTVLSTYLLIVIGYLANIICLRIRGQSTRKSSWKTLQDLVALALNSERSSYLYGASTGISSEEMWNLDVRVRLLEDGKPNLALTK